MIKPAQQRRYYQALLAKESAYEGVFYVGVTTTGVFCRPTCPARKPKWENCEFFKTAKEALLASFRPCLRCRPLTYPGAVSPSVQRLIAAIESEPEKRWKEADFKALALDVSTARRQFKKRFGLTFVEYARARRMGIAMKEIKAGSTVIDAQLTTGYESDSGFRDAFSRIMGVLPSKTCGLVLKATWIDTPLGPMVAVADDEALYLLEFVDRRGLEREVERLRRKVKAAIIPGETRILEQIKEELVCYFEQGSFEFSTPLHLLGSPFCQQVWHALQRIPAGETRAYLDIAKTIERPTSFRAVARANGANQLTLIIPCHRVINSNGELGGYGGGLARKQWLLEHEKS
jgi:AraC family transcriptional regulator, regulatory protein of adaptative response / methylated-DNA-[protein]-cysteine methyltransferase